MSHFNTVKINEITYDSFFKQITDRKISTQTIKIKLTEYKIKSLESTAFYMKNIRDFYYRLVDFSSEFKSLFFGI